MTARRTARKSKSGTGTKRRRRPTPEAASPNYLTLPIGSKIEGGIYAGITYSEGRPCALILGAEHDGELTHEAATDWAKRSGGTLPSRLDNALLFANLPGQFHKDWYWSAETHASGSDGAWLQYFDNGYQDRWLKTSKLRARLVRRSAI